MCSSQLLRRSIFCDILQVKQGAQFFNAYFDEGTIPKTLPVNAFFQHMDSTEFKCSLPPVLDSETVRLSTHHY